MPKLAVQMYTLRDLADADYLGVFEQVAKVGYRAVELAGTGGLPAADLKKHLDNLGITVAATHIGYHALLQDINPFMDYYAELGVKHIVCPFILGELRKSDADWTTIAANLDRWGAAFRARGFVFCYHNHDWDFRKINNEFIWDMIFRVAPPAHLQAELDCYWVARAGEDPVAAIRKLSGRLPLLHIKDMAADKRFAPVGSGTLDWSAILPAADAAGVEWLVVEQDKTYETPPLEAIRISFENLRKMGQV